MSENDPAQNQLDKSPRAVSEQLLSLSSENRTDKAQYILAAAIQLFARKGYPATSVRDIVELAGVTNPMLYYYFDDKEGVFRSAVKLIFENHKQQIQPLLERDISFPTLARALMTKYFSQSKRRPIAAKFIYTIRLSPSESWPEVNVDDIHNSFEVEVAELYDEAVASGKIEPRDDIGGQFFAQQFFGVLNSHLQKTLTQWQHADSEAQRERILAEMFDEQYADRLTDFVFKGAIRSHD